MITSKHFKIIILWLISTHSWPPRSNKNTYHPTPCMPRSFYFCSLFLQFSFKYWNELYWSNTHSSKLYSLRHGLFPLVWKEQQNFQQHLPPSAGRSKCRHYSSHSGFTWTTSTSALSQTPFARYGTHRSSNLLASKASLLAS